MVNIKFARMYDDVIMPSKDEDNAGYDLYLSWESYQANIKSDLTDKICEIKPHTTTMLPTGLKSVIPVTHYAQIYERGSTGSKGMKYSAGVIDSGFRGEWFVCISNINDKSIVIYDPNTLTEDTIRERFENCIPHPSTKGIAQFVLHKVPRTQIEEIPATDIKYFPSKRGTGALGSSGK